MKRLVNQYFKPTPKRMRILGDTLLTLAAAITVYTFNDPALQDYRTGLIIVFLIAGKFLTNFTK